MPAPQPPAPPSRIDAPPHDRHHGDRWHHDRNSSDVDQSTDPYANPSPDDANPAWPQDQPADDPALAPPAPDISALQNAARTQMIQVQARAQANFDASPQWKQLNLDIMRALSDLETARKHVLETLANQPDYQSALAEKQATRQRADSMRDHGDPSLELMLPVAQAALDAAGKVSKLENAALANDPAWQEARSRLASLAIDRQNMLNQLQIDVHNDPVWQAAKQQLDSLG